MYQDVNLLLKEGTSKYLQMPYYSCFLAMWIETKNVYRNSSRKLFPSGVMVSNVIIILFYINVLLFI